MNEIDKAAVGGPVYFLLYARSTSSKHCLTVLQALGLSYLATEFHLTFTITL